ncbi:MAG: Flp family type IVb pilin [Parvularcula sp.]|uniref:Flp family type IVb pilin n=1 Tax=Hyphococcus sp. TaxID=2038636 RepID=UPI000C563F2A|nr:Flp family type IVb pilin [Parvularcula sp.]
MAALQTLNKERRAFAQKLAAFGNSESGATSIEYALIVSLIFLAIVGAVRSYTDSASEVYGEISDAMDQAGS